jgi:hypothetical protein
MRLPGVAEASGVATGRRAPDVLWTHNDSGAAELFAFDRTGTPRGRVPLSGVTVVDWEDIAIGPCPQGSCIYAADIGDNDRARRTVTIYRFAEPKPGDTAIKLTDTWQAAYPDRPHDAEGILVTPGGQLYILTKEPGDSAALYHVPASGNGTPALMQRVALIPLRLATGAAVSADGTWSAMRSNDVLLLYRTKELLAGKTEPAHRVDLTSLREPQGEGVSFSPDGHLYLTGEGSGGGTLATLKCALR